MQYEDRVYGKVEIDEPVVLELINSASMQRLKHIDQAGYKALWAKPDAIVPDYDHSRFAHSVGVYLLLRAYDAPIEEQIAGLLHDVSHSAFSHCADYVFAEGSEKEHTHQDSIHDDFIKRSEIPSILEKYGYNLDYILEDSHFPLKENDLPDICADRIDYSFKTAVIFGEITREDAQNILGDLSVINGGWAFRNYQSAQAFADLFLRLNTIYYCNIESAIMFRAVADYLIHALKMKYITKEDMYTTDDEVIKKIQTHLEEDHKLDVLWQRMNNKTTITNNPDDFDSEVFCKSRVIDPLFIENGKLKRVSEQNKDWATMLVRESQPKHYFLKFEA